MRKHGVIGAGRERVRGQQEAILDSTFSVKFFSPDQVCAQHLAETSPAAFYSLSQRLTFSGTPADPLCPQIKLSASPG